LCRRLLLRNHQLKTGGIPHLIKAERAALRGAVPTLDTLTFGGISAITGLASAAGRQAGFSTDTFFSVGGGPAIGPYSEVSKLGGGNQRAHHVNQDAVFGTRHGGRIPYGEGLSIQLTIDQHNNLHAFMREFYRQYLDGGPLFGINPTNAEYSQRMFDGLLKVGVDQKSAAQAFTEARIQRIQFGYLDDAALEYIPKR
jgi:hypothetical protein